ncbi:hypothetical protein [Paraburkholderia unamae]|uniref:Uncharacterized protein n=1 Tax=Paraburkholderia unamae TaxID=219649 RepID=A0ACC6RTV3_9BURK
MKRRIAGINDLWVCVTLSAIAVWLAASQKLDVDAVATLSGALFGGAAILLGNWTNRYGERIRAAEERQERGDVLKKLIAAELVNVAAGLFDANEIVDSAVQTREAGGHVPDRFDMTSYLPREMPFTDNLGVELLVFEHPVIDALATLRGNLVLTRRAMQAVTEGRAAFGLIQAKSLSASIKHDMAILAEAFNNVAPNRKVQLGDGPAELAVDILNRLSGRQIANG